MVRAATTAEDIIEAMAYDREQFKNKVEEKVGGALLECYKAALATLEGKVRWVQHWQAEADRLIDSELVVVLLHSIKGFKDRRKAAMEVVQQLRSVDNQYRRAAEHIIRRDYGLKRLRAGITDEITEEFYRSVQSVIAAHTKDRV